jgi:hypothetical protein
MVGGNQKGGEWGVISKSLGATAVSLLIQTWIYLSIGT